MRLNRLQIENFRVLSRVDLTLSDQVVGIIGPNGAGKSSLVEAITWALYGNQATRSGKDEVKARFAPDSANCRVRLDFEISGNEYRVERLLVGRSQRGEVNLFRQGQSESVGIRETEAHIAELLQLDLKGFLSSFLARQQELNALSDLTPAKRRDHLAGLLGVGKIDRAIQCVKDDTRVQAGQIDATKKQLTRLPDILVRIDQTTERRAELQATRSRTADQMAISRDEAEAAVEGWQKIQELKALADSLAAEIRTVDHSLAEFQARRDQLTGELLGLEKAANEVRLGLDELRLLPGLREELKGLQEAKQTMQTRQTLKRQMVSLEDEIERANRQRRERQDALAASMAEVKQLPPDLPEQCRRVGTRLEVARSEYSEQKGLVIAAEKELGRLRQQAGQIVDLGPDSVCDRCGRPMGADLDRIRQHLAKEETDLGGALSKMKEGLVQKETAGRNLREQLVERERQATRADECSRQRQADEKEIAALNHRLQRDDKHRQELAQEIGKLPNVLADPDRLQKLIGEEKRLSELQSRIDNLQGQMNRQSAAQSELDQTNQRLSSLESQKTDLAERLRSLEYNPEAYELAQKNLTETGQRSDAARENFYRCEKEVELVEQALEQLLQQKSDLAQQEAELEQLRESRYYAEKLTGLLSQYRQDLISNIRPWLATLSSDLISEMTSGRYQLMELDEKYNLCLLDDGQLYGVDRFSGGEKDLANLCLRLAISQALTESAGLDRSFVILDEVFGSQDNERKELILAALGRLRRHFPQVLLITHVEDIRDRVEQLIEVLPTNRGFSEVRVDGALA